MKIYEKNVLLVTGGTGGHVIPAENLANYLINKKINCNIIIDKRGYKYLKNFKGKIHIINSSNLNGNFFIKFYGSIALLFGFIQSFIKILFIKPKVVISFGSYVSFFPLLSCMILKNIYKIDIFIHEQNSVMGKTNSFFLNYVNKIFLNFDITSKIHIKYHKKIFVVGSPEKNLQYYEKKNIKNSDKIFTIFIFGGSQGSEYVTNFAIKIIKIIDEEKIVNAKFIIQCPAYMKKNTIKNLKNVTSKVIIKDYYDDIHEILKITSLAISRSGAGSIRDLINYSIPSVLIPLPTSKDNHQFHNALIMTEHNGAIIINQNLDELNKAKNYIYETYSNFKRGKFINDKFNKITVKNSNRLIYNLITNEK